MTELINAAIAPPTLVFTCFLMLIFIYWLSVIIGALDMDSLDVDFGTDVDVHDPSHAAHIGDPTQHVEHGLYLGILRFFNFGQLPFMMLLSILILSIWSISILCNHDGSWINPSNNGWIAFGLFFPNLILSLFVTKILTQPLVPFFKKLDHSAQPLQFEGQIGVLTLPLEKNQIGQIKLTINNSVVLAKVRSADGQPLAKGQEVVVVDLIAEEECYIVEPFVR